MQFLPQYINQINAPTVIGGDWNEKGAEKWNLLPELSNLQLITAGKTFHTAKPILALDCFMVTRDILVQNAYVHQSPLSKKASDHFPIVMDITL